MMSLRIFWMRAIACEAAFDPPRGEAGAGAGAGADGVAMSILRNSLPPHFTHVQSLTSLASTR